jgi:hypothetical protein
MVALFMLLLHGRHVRERALGRSSGSEITASSRFLNPLMSLPKGFAPSDVTMTPLAFTVLRQGLFNGRTYPANVKSPEHARGMGDAVTSWHQTFRDKKVAGCECSLGLLSLGVLREVPE